MNSVHEHKKDAPKSVNCMVITISDTRTPETDRSGRLMRELLEQAGHRVIDYRIVRDEYKEIRLLLGNASDNPEIEAVLLNGGTGIAPRDMTFEAVRDTLHKEMPGFGEMFRYLSYTEDIGTAAMLSRAAAGVVGNTAVFSVPGSTGAVKLAMTRLIIPELGHVMREIYKDRRRTQ